MKRAGITTLEARIEGRKVVRLRIPASEVREDKRTKRKKKKKQKNQLKKLGETDVSG